MATDTRISTKVNACRAKARRFPCCPTASPTARLHPNDPDRVRPRQAERIGETRVTAGRSRSANTPTRSRREIRRDPFGTVPHDAREPTSLRDSAYTKPVKFTIPRRPIIGKIVTAPGAVSHAPVGPASLDPTNRCSTRDFLFRSRGPAGASGDSLDTGIIVFPQPDIRWVRRISSRDAGPCGMLPANGAWGMVPVRSLKGSGEHRGSLTSWRIRTNARHPKARTPALRRARRTRR